jgi:hypothetical protein
LARPPRPNRKLSCFPRERLFLFNHPAHEGSSGEAYGKCGRDCQHGVSLDALSCVIQEFFGSVPALLCGTPHGSDAVPNCVGDRVRCARRLVSRVGDLFCCSFHYRL